MLSHLKQHSRVKSLGLQHATKPRCSSLPYKLALTAPSPSPFLPAKEYSFQILRFSWYSPHARCRRNSKNPPLKGCFSISKYPIPDAYYKKSPFHRIFHTTHPHARYHNATDCFLCILRWWGVHSTSVQRHVKKK